MTLYRLLRERCGLSLREAAAFHKVSINTVTAWSAGRRNPPPGVIIELKDLYKKIERASVNPAVKLPCMGATEAAIGLAAMRT